MRKLGEALGVEAMSLYNHVANKDELLDGIVDLVYGEMDLPSAGNDWRTEMQRRSASARQVLGRHPWAIPLLQSRTAPGPATLRHLDALVACLRGAGFSVEMTAHALALVDSYVFGFALSEAALPIHGPESVPEVAESIMQRFSGGAYPHLFEFATEHVMKPGYDFGEEFEFGLGLLLDALADRAAADQAAADRTLADGATVRQAAPRRAPATR
jgi:AcrR family transcriptional regulator